MTVMRWVVTYRPTGQYRQLALPQQGRFTYATADEAETWLTALRADPTRAPQELESLRVARVECHDGHFDPVGIFVTLPDEAKKDQELENQWRSHGVAQVKTGKGSASV